MKVLSKFIRHFKVPYHRLQEFLTQYTFPIIEALSILKAGGDNAIESAHAFLEEALGDHRGTRLLSSAIKGLELPISIHEDDSPSDRLLAFYEYWKGQPRIVQDGLLFQLACEWSRLAMLPKYSLKRYELNLIVQFAYSMKKHISA